ncbi:MAG: hypothetical protein E6J45_12105 [Chloroflexi bacterium]|nr:MAG: hypothetical protein E6J45_12105 [Chloroflexota bacterium]
MYDDVSIDPGALLHRDRARSGRCPLCRVIAERAGTCRAGRGVCPRALRRRTESQKLEAAIATYFANVGQRWDVEQLELGGVVGA